MTQEVQALMKALEVGSYNAAPGQLVGGAALQVEDLSCTLRLVTFSCATFASNKEFNRLLKNLNQRQIPYRLTSRRLNKRQLITFSWNKKLKVGKKTLLFRVSP